MLGVAASELTGTNVVIRSTLVLHTFEVLFCEKIFGAENTKIKSLLYSRVSVNSLRVLCGLLFKTQFETEGRKVREVGQSIVDELVRQSKFLVAAPPGQD